SAAFAGAGAGSAASSSTTAAASATSGSAAAGASSAFGWAGPPFLAAARISCTLGRFAIARSQPPVARRPFPARAPGEDENDWLPPAAANRVPPHGRPDRLLLI